MTDQKITELEFKCKSLMSNLDKAIDAINNLTGVNESLLLETNKYNKIINSTQKQVDYYKQKYSESIMNESPIKLNNATTDDAIKSFFEYLHLLSKQKNRNVNSMLDLVSKQLFNTTEFDGAFASKMIQRSQDYYRNNIFSPQNLLKLLDQNGGQISMTGMDLLRTLENKCVKYSRNSVFPSIATIRRCASAIDKKAEQVVPYKEGVLPNGSETCEFK